MKLKSKKEVPYSGKVYDLSVKNKSSYNVEGIPVHNSGAGSLVCYATGITQVDPIKHGLLFERFLSKKKACLLPETYVKTITGSKQIKDLSIGDLVLTHKNVYKPVILKTKSFHSELVQFTLENGQIFKSSPNHIWIVNRDGKKQEVKASEIKETDEFIEMLQSL